MSGGAGYVLSKESLKRFVEIGLPNKFKCKVPENGAEDAELGICLAKIGVVAVDERDSNGKERFFPFTPESHVNTNYDNDWYSKYAYYPLKQVL